MLSEQQLLFTIRIMEREITSNPCVEDQKDAARIVKAMRKELYLMQLGALYVDADYGRPS